MDRGHSLAHQAAPSPPPIRWSLIAIASAASGVTVALVAVPGVRATTTASRETALVQGVTRGVIVAIPLAVALYAYQRPAHVRAGRLLLGFSGLWLVAMLASSSSAFVYSVGRIAGWISLVFLAYAILAFPSGQLVSRVDRVLVRVLAVAAMLLYVSTALLIARYPSPSPFVSCDAGCPHNAFMLTGHEPAFVTSVLSPIRDFFTILILLVVAARLGQRLRGANSLLRRTLVPLFLATIVCLVLIATLTLMRRIAAHSVAIHTAAWLVALAVPAIAVAFVIGIFRWHLFVTAAMQRANARLQKLPSPLDVRNVLAEVFEDPALQIGRWLRKRRQWVTVDGQTLQTPSEDSGRWLTQVRDQDNRRLIAIEHDAILRAEPAFIDTAASLGTIAFEGQRLEARSADTLRELRASRARLLAAADSERRRIARDLHDGAQARLVALRIELELAAEQAEQDNASEARTLREFSAEIEVALDDFRSMTRGIYPAILGDRGIADALRAAALRSPLPTTVEVEALAGYPQEIATAAYFCCLEALQNAAKHARGATKVRIVLGERDSVLRFSISDDGCGFRSDRARLGAGVINMRDRLAAVGGELTIHSSPGHGTRIVGRIPLTAQTTALGGARETQTRRPSRQHLRRDHAR